MAFELPACRIRVSLATGFTLLCDREQPETAATAAHGPEHH